MNAILNPLLDPSRLPTLEPTLALLFHTRGNALELVTSHRLQQVRGKAVLGPGEMLSPADEQTVLRLLTASDTDAPGPVQILPPNLLYQDRRQIAWFVPSAERPMHFHAGHERAQRVVRWPSLIFRVVDHTLFVASVVGDERPSGDTQLVKCPLPNIWSNAQVCMGNAPLPAASMIEDIPAWETAFFTSAFSHANDRQVIKGSRGFVDPMNHWQTHKQPCLTECNAVPLRCTLGEWLAQMPREGRH